jgi:WD40 repeat protein
MTETWQSLAKERKDKKKSIVAVPPETLKSLAEVDKKNWHKTRNKAGIVDMKSQGNEIVTAGRDKQLIVYSLEKKTLVQTVNIGVVATSVDINATRLVAGLSDGTILQYVDGAAVGDALATGANAVDIALHPTGKHVVVILENAKVAFCRIAESGLHSIYTFDAPDGQGTAYACGALHPDGLICAAGTTAGAVHLWDFKNQKLADTYEVRQLRWTLCTRVLLFVLTIRFISLVRRDERVCHCSSCLFQ